MLFQHFNLLLFLAEHTVLHLVRLHLKMRLEQLLLPQLSLLLSLFFNHTLKPEQLVFVQLKLILSILLLPWFELSDQFVFRFDVCLQLAHLLFERYQQESFLLVLLSLDSDRCQLSTLRLFFSV